MLATMRANSVRPSPIPECSSACAGTLPTAPPALTLVYPDIVRCERVAVAAVVWNLDGGNLAAAVNARERNDERVISRNRAPATNQSGVYSDEIGDSPINQEGHRQTGAAASNATSAPPPPILHSSPLSVRTRDGGNARESSQGEDRSDRTHDQNPPGHGQRMRTRLEQKTGSHRGHDDVQPIDNGCIRMTFPNRSSGEQRPGDMRTVIHVCWEKKCISQYVPDQGGKKRTRQVGRSSEQYADRKMERQVTDGHLVRVSGPECDAG